MNRPAPKDGGPGWVGRASLFVPPFPARVFRPNHAYLTHRINDTLVYFALRARFRRRSRGQDISVLLEARLRGRYRRPRSHGTRSREHRNGSAAPKQTSRYGHACNNLASSLGYFCPKPTVGLSRPVASGRPHLRVRARCNCWPDWPTAPPDVAGIIPHNPPAPAGLCAACKTWLTGPP